jgi:cyclic pyranopterin phosphate synthase
MAAKETSRLIPLCHSIRLDRVEVDFEFEADPSSIVVHATATATDRTGVEMEALTAVSVACLTIYDMCKAMDRGMVIGEIRLIEKTGGQGGDYVAE